MRKTASIIFGYGEGIAQSGTFTVCHLDISFKFTGTFENLIKTLVPAGKNILYNDGYHDHIVALKGKVTKKAKRMFSLDEVQ